MSDHQGDPELSEAFDELRESVGSDVDVDAGLQELHRTAGSGGGQGRGGIRRPAILGIAAALLAVLAIGSVAVWHGGDRSDQVLSADGADNASAAPAESTCENEAFVYLNPSATGEQISAVGQTIAGLDGLESSTYVDPADTYEEFQRLFADQPEFVDSINPAELPSSFRVSFAPRITTEQVDLIEAIPGVYRVEVPSEYDCPTRAATPETTIQTEATTTTSADVPTTQSLATTAPPPVAVDRASDITMGTMTLASAEAPAACVEGGEGRTPDQEALGCPPPGEQILGTVVIDGTTILITSTTALFGCGPTDGAMPIPFSEVLSPPGGGGAFGPVAVWFLDPSADDSLPLVRAAQLSFGGCG